MRHFVDAFRLEAELSARLVHANITQVLDFGREGESYFLAMEYVDGLTLQALMQRTQAAQIAIPMPIVAYMGREILAGLDHAHNAARASDGSLLRVIHRDPCPANVLLSNNGEVKITDFGVAKALRDAEVAETTTVAGHAGYMPPEQARAQPIDARCDLFSLGVLLWELVCGKRLFYRGSEGPTLLATITDEVVAPTSLRQDIDPGWDDLLLRATQRQADRRFDSAREMADALMHLREARPGGAAVDLAELVARVHQLPEPVDGAAAASATSDLPTRVAKKR